MSLPQDGGQFLFANGNEQKWKCADNPQDTHTTPRRGLLRRGRLPDRYQPPKGWKRVGMGNVGTASSQNLQQLLDALALEPPDEMAALEEFAPELIPLPPTIILAGAPASVRLPVAGRLAGVGVALSHRLRRARAPYASGWWRSMG